MGSKIALVTDSTAYIPKNLVEQYGITVIAQTLLFGEEALKDGIDIQPNDFYARLKNSSVLPTTSQASPAAFHEVFKGLLDQDYQVLAVLISSDLSGTISSAVQAKAMLGDAPLQIFDSRTSSMALGFQVLAAARAAQDGATLAECHAVAEAACANTGIIFAVDTLEFLHRGGRIGGAARLLGTALNIKPILEVQNGKVESIEKVRTRKKSLQRMVELVEERINGRQPLHLAVVQAHAEAEAEEMQALLSQHFNPVESLCSAVSPVVGTHIGPGTLGLAYLAGM